MFSIVIFSIGIAQVLGASNVSTASPSGLSPQSKELCDKIHGICMLFAWFFFVIVAIGSARYFKEFKSDYMPMGVRIWFFIHRIFNIIGIILMIGGLLAIFIAHEWKWSGPTPNGETKNYSATAYHTMFGIFAVCLAFIQPLGALLRCDMGARMRPIFNLAHRLVGVIAWIFAAITITLACKFFGQKHFSNPDASLALCTTFIAITAAVFIISEFLTVYSKIQNKGIEEAFKLEKPRILPIQTLMFAMYILISFGICLAIGIMMAVK